MFDTLENAVLKFGKIAAEFEAIRIAALEAGAQEFLKRAKAAIGTYEYGWPSLAESTIASKGGADTPGLETGDMQASGSYEVHAASFTVGFTDPKTAWFEFGTSRQPPRPIIGGTIDHHGAEIARLVGIRFGEIMAGTLATGSVATSIARSFSSQYSPITIGRAVSRAFRR
jgi:hypothetical protein